MHYTIRLEVLLDICSNVKMRGILNRRARARSPNQLAQGFVTWLISLSCESGRGSPREGEEAPLPASIYTPAASSDCGTELGFFWTDRLKLLIIEGLSMGSHAVFSMKDASHRLPICR